VCRGILDERDFVIDYAEISDVVNPIVEFLDHKNLNEILPFKTTAENLCRYIFDEVAKSISIVYQIHFYETAKTRVTYPI
jgi:6-pyruvoyltetrahydropterin/6-carboxytetrahydropterin synthase